MKKILILLVCIFGVYACEDVETGYKFYFFPVDELHYAKVYAYRNENNFKDIIYYALKSISEKEKKFLHIEIFDGDFHKKESYRLRITPQGAFAEEYITYTDSNRYQLKIYSDTLLIWDKINNSNFLFEASNNRPETRNQQVVKKVRCYTGKKGEINFCGAEYKTIELSEEEFNNDGNDKICLNRSIYKLARGLGIIGFRIKQDNKPPVDYKLDKILTFPEWKKISGENKVN